MCFDAVFTIRLFELISMEVWMRECCVLISRKVRVQPRGSWTNDWLTRQKNEELRDVGWRSSISCKIFSTSSTHAKTIKSFNFWSNPFAHKTNLHIDRIIDCEKNSEFSIGNAQDEMKDIHSVARVRIQRFRILIMQFIQSILFCSIFHVFFSSAFAAAMRCIVSSLSGRSVDMVFVKKRPHVPEAHFYENQK